MTAPQTEVPSGDTIMRLTEILDRTLRLLGDRVDDDLAAQLAAEAWWLLQPFPESAERVNRTMHYLTARMPRRRREESGTGNAEGMASKT